MLFMVILAMLLSGAISLWLTVRACQRWREVPAAPWLAGLMGGISLWSFAYGAELNLQTLEAMRWSAFVTYIGVATTPVFWFGFAMSQAGKGHLLTRWRAGLLFLLPAGIIMLVATNPSHFLFYRDVRLEQYDGFYYQALLPGPFWWLHLLYSYLFVMSGIVVMVRLWFRVRGTDRKRIGFILAVMMIPYIVNITYAFGLIRPGGFLDLTPVGFTVMGVLLFYAVFQLDIFDVFPQALDTLFDNLPDALFVLTAHYAIVSTNPAGNRLLQDSAFQKEFGTEKPGPVGTDRIRIPEEKAGRDVVLGDKVWALRILPLQLTSGQVTGHLAIFQDITRRKADEQELLIAKEKAEQATQAKSMFLANMSHEIRTPMNAVMGMTQLALRANPAPKLRDYLIKADTAAKSLLMIINDILDFSKIEAGHLELEDVTFSLAAVLNNLEAVIGMMAREKQLSLNITVAPNTPNWLKGDPLRLGQILVNLGTNAVKFTRQGGIHVMVSVEEIDASMVGLLFTVQDTGIGINPKNISMLLEPFRQEDSSMTRKYGGTGLGLAICGQLVEMMGGTIQIQSEPGQGSVFSFTIRLGLPNADETPDIPDQTAALTNGPAKQRIDTLAGCHVLLVEDNALNRDLALALLSELGISVEIAIDGREGVQRATTEPFDVILMDIQMPEIDGLEATRRIRHIEDEKLREVKDGNPSNIPANRHSRIPIIAMTAHAMSGDRERSLKAGMDDHLTKPIDPAMLREALLRWISEGGRDRRSEVGDQASDIGQRRSEIGGRRSSTLQALLPTCLPPFDIPAALTRCNSSELLHKLLLIFRSEYTGATQHLRQLLKDNRLADAQRLAHTLKSGAAALEAREVAQAAKELELALRSGQIDDLDDRLQALETVLAPALAAAQSLEQAPSASGMAPDTAPPESCVALTPDTHEILKELRSHLEFNNLKARRCFASVAEVLSSHEGITRQVATLSRSIDRLDYQSALSALDVILALSENHYGVDAYKQAGV